MALTFDVVASARGGKERIHRYAADSEVKPGDILRLSGRYWLVVLVEPTEEDTTTTAVAVPARYRVRLRHPDGRAELGALRRYRTGAPSFGHAFTSLEDGEPVSWQVVDQRVEKDEQGEHYLELLAQRDFAEAESLPDHELEHALATIDERIPAEAFATLRRAAEEGLAIELVALDPGEESDWDEAERYIRALVLDEIEDDLLELCGVDPNADPPETWLATVKASLESDLAQFRADIEGDHDQIEEWDYLDGRIFASVGSWEDEANPDRGHGWMCRLLDSGALSAAGFARVRKTDL